MWLNSTDLIFLWGEKQEKAQLINPNERMQAEGKKVPIFRLIHVFQVEESKKLLETQAEILTAIEDLNPHI